MNEVENSVIVEAAARPEGTSLSKIKHVIAVASGKGGVGKSTTAVNLAAALRHLGAKVGLLDADIYGPSVPKLLGSELAPTQNADGKINPPVIHGMKCMSMGLLGSSSPIVWRGPMASKVLNQFLGDVDWGELDYLIVDLPPGTGDIQITLAQSARLSGAVIVMTPQALAGDIAKRGLKMFQQVRVPVIGIVENMSGFECPSCHTISHIFKKGGGASVAEELHLPLLSTHPLDPELVDEGDRGLPVVLSRPGSDSAQRYLSLAKSMATELRKVLAGSRQEHISLVALEPNYKGKMFKVTWSDSKQSLVGFKQLRYLCPCASCVDENTGVRKIQESDVKDDIHPLRVQTIGNYAVQVHWSDSHNTGLYSYDYLRRAMVKEASPLQAST